MAAARTNYLSAVYRRLRDGRSWSFAVSTGRLMKKAVGAPNAGAIKTANRSKLSARRGAIPNSGAL